MDISNDGWHARQNQHNFVQLTMQFAHAVKLRNMSLVTQYLATQPIPLRAPLITPVSDTQARIQATDLLKAYQTHEEHLVQFQRYWSLS